MLPCAEVAQKKVARKPKDTSFSLSRYWRTIGKGHRHAIVMVLVLLALLSIALIHVNSANIEKSAAQLAKRLEAERREAANLEARRKCVHLPLPPGSPGPLVSCSHILAGPHICTSCMC